MWLHTFFNSLKALSTSTTMGPPVFHDHGTTPMAADHLADQLVGAGVSAGLDVSDRVLVGSYLACGDWRRGSMGIQLMVAGALAR